MKNLFSKLVLIVLALIPCVSEAASYDGIRVTGKDKTQTFLLTETPAVSYKDRKVVINTSKETVEFPIAGGVEIAFINDATGIADVTVGQGIAVSDNEIVFSGYKGVIQIYDVSGRLVSSAVASGGVANISTASLGKGVFIIKTTNQTFKIVRK